MTRSTRRPKLILFLCGALLVSGVLLGSARASDPDHVIQLQKTRSCVNCDLSDADLSGYNLPKADLSGADLTGAKLYKADLTNAKLTATNFINCDLTGANLTGAVDANFAGAKTTAGTTCPDGSAGPCK
jgi:uncharacterized protein YjbI with pentapeptide repeats